MPHNFYLHSGIYQVRKIDSRNQEEIRQAVKYTETDSNIQLTIAFIINSLLLIMGAAVLRVGLFETVRSLACMTRLIIR